MSQSNLIPGQGEKEKSSSAPTAKPAYAWLLIPTSYYLSMPGMPVLLMAILRLSKMRPSQAYFHCLATREASFFSFYGAKIQQSCQAICHFPEISKHFN